ncbi:uncharacterized protein [Montipora capricornis]|uniref:uncharacterized protein isoform X2 n=1 Tax=Montipora capricornis TaxID=246305 RepID=UPI0035F17C95
MNFTVKAQSHFTMLCGSPVDRTVILNLICSPRKQSLYLTDLVMVLRIGARDSLDTCCGLFRIIALCCLAEKVFCSTVLWPLGQYGLPMPKSNCPPAHGFSWKKGNIYQDLEDKSNQTRISPQSHLHAMRSSTDVIRFFCMKTDKTTAFDASRNPWPKGQYCIYQKGSSCPAGMLSGSVLWDDENGVNGNRNARNGEIPEGVYNDDTKIFFCCHTSGSYNVPIELPTAKPFYLIAFRPHCQEVLNTGHIMEFIQYATEIDNNHNQKSFPYPYGAEFRNPRIHYCYYFHKACVQELTAPKGTFSSPYYPQQYNNKASCKWHIKAPWNHTILLTFEDFELQSGCCKCDYVEVWETYKNGSLVLIETFCGDGKPDSSQPVRSRSNNVTVIFHSDANVTSKGFNASYQSIAEQVFQPTSISSLATTNNNETGKTTMPPSTTTTTTTAAAIISRSEETSTSKVTHKDTIPTESPPSSTPAADPTTRDSTDQAEIISEAREENIRDARVRGNETKVNAVNVIVGVVSVLIVQVGVIALIRYCRQRRNENQDQDPGRFSVIYSNPEMKKESVADINLSSTEVIIMENKNILERDLPKGSRESNAYEEVKDTKNPLYSRELSEFPNIYDELRNVNDSLKTGGTENKNARRKNNPVYESTENKNPRRKNNPAYESVDITLLNKQVQHP